MNRIRESRWWHEYVLRHRLWCDISRARMVTHCVCGDLWVTVGDPECAWTSPSELS